MTFKKLMLTIVIPVLFLINMGCPVGDPNNERNLPVAYYEQECFEWCGIACIQMWADWDGNCVTQTEIADYTGVGNDTATAQELLIGVGHYTAVEGYLEERYYYEHGAQGDLISSTINGVLDYTPSIMPFYGDHAVLIKGYRYHRDEYGRPIAERVYYHDPNEFVGGPNKTAPGADLGYLFQPAPYRYWVILGQEDYVQDGMEGHDAFVLQGGLVYGLPGPYDPKDLREEPL